MMNLLHTIGLMRRAEHEREVLFYVGQARGLAAETAEFAAKFKRAATDLAAQAEEIARLNDVLIDMRGDRDAWQEDAEALRPDAEAMRRKRAADRKRMAGKRGKA